MSNYKAIIAKVDHVAEIPNADTIQVAFVLGESVVVGKHAEVGDVGVLFCAGTQLSEDFCKYNNLHRDSSKNSNPEAKGFFEDNRKVRAQPFMKVRSEGYFATLDSLQYTGHDVSSLKVGDSFEELNGVKVCCKYINPRVKVANPKGKKLTKRRSVPTFLEHVGTAQFKHNIHKLKKGDLISIQSKKHGTSFRSAYLPEVQDLPKWKKLINKVAPVFPEQVYKYITGTRRVILKDPEGVGYHGSDAYRFGVTESLKPYLVKGMTVFGEIVGYVNGSPIMSTHNTSGLKDKRLNKKYGDVITYKYGCPEGTYKFHIYRITMTTEDGDVTEFTQPQLVKWCKDRGLEPSYDVVEPFIYDGNADALASLVEALTERPECLCEDYHDPSQISEGIIIRIDNENLQPFFLKSKSYYFKVLESICEEVDIEDLGGVDE